MFNWSDDGRIVGDMTISPFGVWHKSEGGKWGTLADGVDMGSFWRIGSLDSGQSEEYSFKVREKGEKRLLLEYAFEDGANTDCSNPYKKWKKVWSLTFTVR
jgi:hypothetical protein